MADYLKHEDYAEPQCLLCETDPQSKEASVTRIPTSRVIEKLDAYFAKNDLAGAERHLRYWEKEALEGGDDRGRFTVSNELTGLLRKLGRRDEALDYAARTLTLAEALGMSENVTGATALLNAGTVYKAFGEPEKGLPLFERAGAIYEAQLAPDDARLAGLWNNMALTLVDLGRFEEAAALYDKAIRLTEQTPGMQGDAAISLLNKANLIEARDGLLNGNDAICACLDRAEALLNDPALPRDGYHAFVCEKCAPTFGYYGYFAVCRELEERAEQIYAGT